MTTKQSILDAPDRDFEVVDVPKWGKVSILVMSGAERDAFEQSCADENKRATMENIRARLLVRTLGDEEGKRLFEDSDAAALGKKSGKILGKLFDLAQKANGLSKEDIDELRKN